MIPGVMAKEIKDVIKEHRMYRKYTPNSEKIRQLAYKLLDLTQKMDEESFRRLTNKEKKYCLKLAEASISL